MVTLSLSKYAQQYLLSGGYTVDRESISVMKFNLMTAGIITDELHNLSNLLANPVDIYRPFGPVSRYLFIAQGLQTALNTQPTLTYRFFNEVKSTVSLASSQRILRFMNDIMTYAPTKVTSIYKANLTMLGRVDKRYAVDYINNDDNLHDLLYQTKMLLYNFLLVSNA